MVKHQRRSSVRLVSFFVVVALALGGCGVSATSSGQTSTPSVTPTAYVASSSECAANSNFINQSLTGRITGCFRVPANLGTSLVVSLQAYLDNSMTTSNETTTTRGPSSRDTLSLSVATTTALPGDHVVVVGSYARGSSVTKSAYANLCWDGCQTGLVEQAVPLHWTSSRTFNASLEVPASAWLELKSGAVSVHPLVSGKYQVAIQCVQQTSGCALRPGDATTYLSLKAPTPHRCVTGRPCASLQLSLRHAAPGDEVIVSGWAPLQSIIGQPFGLNLSIATSRAHHYAALSSSQNSKGGGFNVVLSPKIFTVTPDSTWASLGRLSYDSSTWAGPSPLSPVPGPPEVAWCSASGPTITEGTTSSPVPTAGVRATLRGSGLSLLPGSSSTPRCETIIVDPLHRSSIFVGFDAAVGGSIPPVFMAGLYTTNAGATWQWVPTPTGLLKQDFSGFEASGTKVVATFFDTNQGGGYDSFWPLGSNHGLIDTEVTTNGGVSWTPSTLSCPSSGPCEAFGPLLLGNCAMNGSNQSLMSAVRASATSATVRWQSSPWVSTVNNCDAQQLVATSAHGLLLVDPSSQYELLQSTNSGQSWVNRSVPRLPGQSYPLSYGDVLLFAPTGDLLAMVNTPTMTHQRLFRLAPGSTSWCQVPNVFDNTKGAWTIDSIRVDASDLLWIQTRFSNSASPPSELHVLPLSKIKC